MMTIDEVESLVLQFREKYQSFDHSLLADSITSLKRDSVAENNELTATRLWCIESAFHAQRMFLSGFAHCKLREFYAGWCAFERAELALKFLKGHFEENWATFRLDWTEKYVEKYQSLFPYKVFASVGILVKERHCSICNSRLGLRNRCPHKKGMIYGGEMCCEVIGESEILEVSLVSNPVQKCCVTFGSDPNTGSRVDNYDYTMVDFIAQRVVGPFDGWNVIPTTRVVRSEVFSELGTSDRCPCNSGKTYFACCRGRRNMTIPHMHVEFELPPPTGVSTFTEANAAPIRGKLTRHAANNRFWTRYAVHSLG